MKIFNNLNTRKSAMVTMEVLLAIILTLGALFLVLGLFNNNLKEMVDNSGFQSLFKKDVTATAYENTNKDYTNSQLNVQIAGQQGLQWYMDKTQDLIDVFVAKSAENPPVPLTASQQIDLAKYFTVKSILNQWEIADTGSRGDENALAAANGINNGEGVENPSLISVGHSSSTTIDVAVIKPEGYITWQPAGSRPFSHIGINASDAKARDKERIDYLVKVIQNFDTEKAKQVQLNNG